MNPNEIHNRQCELEERRLGMRSTDPVVIAHHFGKAAELRALIAAERLQFVSGTIGTSGCRPPRPQ